MGFAPGVVFEAIYNLHDVSLQVVAVPEPSGRSERNHRLPKVHSQTFDRAATAFARRDRSTGNTR
jgi:hypothetical protein